MPLRANTPSDTKSIARELGLDLQELKFPRNLKQIDNGVLYFGQLLAKKS